MISSPAAADILFGLDISMFDDLSVRQRKVLAVIMARAAERSYRRGFQQGASLITRRPDSLRPDLHDWRYGDSTDASPDVEYARVETALDRLHTENNGLSRLIPREAVNVGAVDADQAADRLRHLAAEYHQAWDDDRNGKSVPYLLTRSSLFAFGVELNTLGGSQAMVDAIDDVVEQHGDDAVRGVLGVWNGIGDFYD